MRFLRNTLCVCVVLHFHPGLFKRVECALVMKPQNVAVLSGESVTLRCASGHNSKGNIAWNIINPGHFLSELMFIDGILAPSVASYISVSDSDDGNCSLHINASVSAAKRYICIDRETGEEASAELIVLESLKCESSDKASKKSVYVRCSVTSAGNWAPMVNCRSFDEHGMTILEGNRTERFTGKYFVKSIWDFSGKKKVLNIVCLAKFDQFDIPKGTSATNIPENDIWTNAYRAPEPEESCDKEILTTVFLTSTLILLAESLVIVCWVLNKRAKKRTRKETENVHVCLGSPNHLDDSKNNKCVAIPCKGTESL